MIPVAHPIPEPGDFDAECRRKGSDWLAANPGAKTSHYPAYWAKYENDLATAFHQRCGWWAMWIAEGAVEHFLSKKNRPDLAYEWSNYRYVAGSVNGSKGNHDDKVLDPFEVQDGWFEVLLPSMQLVATANLPTALAPKAEFTLKQLKLRNGSKVLRCRSRWYRQYRDDHLTLEGLRSNAPLVAAAVQKLLDSGQALP